MNIIFNLIVRTLSVLITTYLISGVQIDSYLIAIVVAIVLGILNVFVKPLLVILTLPVNVVTLGLFTLVINAFLVLLTSFLVAGFHVNSFMAGLLFSLVLSLVNWFLSTLVND
ncbi:phage holin family protein [Patescibacteria group bacterium]